MSSPSYSTEVEYLDPEFMRGPLADYGLVLVCMNDYEVEQSGIGYDHYVDASYIIHPMVYVGFYTDRDKLVASVFHEIGHRLIRDAIYEESKLTRPVEWAVMAETLAWKLGYQEAFEYGYTFKRSTLEWSTQQLLSYIRSSCVDCEAKKEPSPWQLLKNLANSLAESTHSAMSLKMDPRRCFLTLLGGVLKRLCVSR